MPIYKHGKQTSIMSFQEVKKKVLDTKLSISDEAFFWLLYYCGVRKSEGYERVAEDFEVNDTHLIVDFHERKKHGKTVDPLELPLHKVLEKAKNQRPRVKIVFVYEPSGETRTTKKGRVVPINKRVGKRVKACWVWPKIQSTKAWKIVRAVLGEGYYPHFLRLNRLSEIAGDPTSSLLRLSSFSGIKSTRALDAYLGRDKKEQKAAFDFIEKQQS